jgi:spore germination cell wall hydrolase CwlJ-like protein
MAEAIILSRPLDGLKRKAAAVATSAVRQARKLWRAYPRETAGVGLLGLVGAAAVAGSAYQAAPTQGAAPPAPPPLELRQIAPAQALKVNAEIPLTAGPNPAARPFAFKGDAAARGQALECLSSAVYYEAGSQDDDGERAVAQVVLNRVRHAAFPASVCGVVFEGSTRPTGCQFTFTCDGSLNRQPDAQGWRRASRIAEAALAGYVFKPVGLATQYHADYVVPYWASTLAKNAIVGAHIFYRWAGGWGQPAAFVKAYAGHEPSARALRTAALAAPHVAPQGAVAAAIEDIPGAEAIKLAPSMRGDKRVAVRFNLAARKASDEAPHEEYAKKFEASDNLKWALSGDTSSSNEKPLGTTSKASVPPRAVPAAPAPVAAGER